MGYKRIILASADEEREEIAQYLMKMTGSSKVVEDFFNGVDHAVNLITEFPTMFPLSRMPELAEKGYRAALAGSYVILYTFSEDTVFVEHVFHQRQDYATMV